MSNYEEIKQKILNGDIITEADFVVMSRFEKALIACINGTGIEDLGIPQSRAEELLSLLSLKMEQISSGGGGGGTAQVFEDVAAIPENPDDQKIYRVGVPQLYTYLYMDYELKLITAEDALRVLVSDMYPGVDVTFNGLNLIPVTSLPSNPLYFSEIDESIPSIGFNMYIMNNDIYACRLSESGELVWAKNDELCTELGMGGTYGGVISSLDTSTMQEGYIYLHYTVGDYINVVNGVEVVLNGGGNNSGGGSGSGEPELVYTETKTYEQGSVFDLNLHITGYTPTHENLKVEIILKQDGGEAITIFNKFNCIGLNVGSDKVSAFTCVTEGAIFNTSEPILRRCIILQQYDGCLLGVSEYIIKDHKLSVKSVTLDTNNSAIELTVNIYEMPTGGSGSSSSGGITEEKVNELIDAKIAGAINSEY